MSVVDDTVDDMVVNDELTAISNENVILMYDIL